MSAVKPCNDYFEDLVAFAIGELDPAAIGELQQHMAGCDKCREVCGALMEEEKEIRASFEVFAQHAVTVERVVQREFQQQPSPRKFRGSVSNNYHSWERVKNMILAHRRVSVAAAASLTALAAGLIVYLSLVSPPGAAYALEQTARANEQVTSYHVKMTPADELGEAWVQLKPDGTPLRARLDLLSPDDGAKVVIFSEGKAEIWFKDKKGHTFIPEKDALAWVIKMRNMADPKLAFERLQAEKGAGKVQVESKEPTKQGDPITLTVTPKDKADRREVYEVNPQTKLVERVTRFQRRDERWEQVGVKEYLDYNQPIDPKVFQLDLPEDVVTVDQIKRKPGLVKGDLADEQIAIKVAREFFEALIAQDYDKAGLLYSGMPAEKMKEVFSRFKFYRIVELGKPTPDASTKSLRVPLKVEWEIQESNLVQPCSTTVRLTDVEKATKAVREFYEALIGQDYEQAGRIAKETGLTEEGITAEEMKNLKDAFEGEHIKVRRIIEVGKPVPHPESGTTEVPLKIELEMNKGKDVREFSPFVRPVDGQPDRWNISGGI